MIWRAITGATFALALAAGPALADCTGDELFADDFSDPVASKDIWGQGDFFNINKGYLEIKVKPRYTGWVAVPSGQRDFNVCFDVTYPEAKNPDGGTYGGIVFWFKDWQNFYGVVTTPIGAAGAFRITKDRWLNLVPFYKRDVIKAGPGQKNSFQVTVKGSVGTVYANNEKLFAFRAVASEALDNVGLLAHSEEDQENPWQFGNVKLTDPGK
jgi:hypothetical protein